MIRQTATGNLDCDQHVGPATEEVNWCNHIADFVAAGRDAEFIHPVDETMIVKTPMLPTLELWQEVDLAALVARARGVCVIEFEYDGVYHTAGHLMPGEGRGVIRENLIQWMLTQPGITGDACKSSSHSWAQAERLRRMDGEPKFLMEQWCMMTTKMCTVCYKKSLDIADVIPKDS